MIPAFKSNYWQGVRWISSPSLFCALTKFVTLITHGAQNNAHTQSYLILEVAGLSRRCPGPVPRECGREGPARLAAARVRRPRLRGEAWGRHSPCATAGDGKRCSVASPGSRGAPAPHRGPPAGGAHSTSGGATPRPAVPPPALGGPGNSDLKVGTVLLPRALSQRPPESGPRA